MMNGLARSQLRWAVDLLDSCSTVADFLRIKEKGTFAAILAWLAFFCS